MGRHKATSDEGKRVLARIRRIKPFVEGSLTVTWKRCGNPKCRCASEGPIHETALLTWKEAGTTRTLYVPAQYRKEVEGWVKEAKLLKRLAKEMSDKQRQFLIRRKTSKKA
ncbi:DUF6788 family protein [Acidobacteriota bacterium]